MVFQRQLLSIGLLSLVALPGCEGFRPLANAGACRTVSCSGHGLCLLAEDGSAQCRCDEGYRVQAGVRCLPAADADLGTDSDGDSDSDTDADSSQLCSGVPFSRARILEPPLAEIRVGSRVALDGTASFGTEERPLRYTWYASRAPHAAVAGFEPEGNPNAERAMDSISTAPAPVFEVDAAGEYGICLNVCFVGGMCSRPADSLECRQHLDACLVFLASP